MRVEEITNKKIWERFALSQHPNVFLQSWNWGKTHQILGKKVFRFGLFERNKLVGVAQLIKEEAKRGTHLILPAGPVLKKWCKEYLSILMRAVKSLAQEERVVFVRVRPNIEKSEMNQAFFRRLGLVSAPMHLHAESTLQLDLRKPLNQLLAEMRKNTRYDIRRSEREGVKTEISHDPEEVKILYQLQMETAGRHQFVPFSEEFFEAHFRAFLDDDQIALIKATYQGVVLAIGMFVFYGDTVVYHYSGSSSKYPKIPATYAMLWRAVQEGKRRGCQIFDLWGIAPTDNPRHRFAGVTLFKKGFGGQRVDYLPAQDWPLTWSYWLTYVFETCRRLQRGL